MMCDVGVESLVADSGAFIKAAPLERWSKTVYTVKEVVDEIRDANTRRRLQVLPYELVFREPTPEAIRHVTAFAKKTGDYPSLSHVDLKLMALTYQLECELGPEKGANLRKEPQRTQIAVKENRSPRTVGFYSGSDKTVENATSTELEIDPSKASEKITSACEDPNVIDREEHTPAMVELEARIAGVQVQEDSSDTERNCHYKHESSEQECNDTVGERDHQDVVRNGYRVNEELHRNTVNVEWNGDCDDVECDDDSDSNGWITPENFRQACEEMGGVSEERANGVVVGCTTTDFAMQNVMLQMGLTVISLDGMRIRQLRTYAMRCKACLKTTSNTTEVFCPHCGNRTLIRVSVQLDENGTTHYQHLSDKQFSHRGLRYSLPLPKGGRHALNPILAPDQRVTQKERRSRTKKVNPLDPDYVAQESPFAMKDVTSRGATIASTKRGRNNLIHGQCRGNPNAVRPKGKRK